MNQVLSGFNVILMGPSGSGKTHAIGTLVETGLEVFYIPLESGAESLVGYWTDRGLAVPSNLHMHALQQPQASFMDIAEAAKKTNSLPHDAVMKMVDARRSKYDGYLKLLGALHGFTDQRTGVVYEPADQWGTDRVVVLDGLTGLNDYAMQLVIGGRAERTQTDWGVAQAYVMSLIKKLCDGCTCHFVLIAHIEREVDVVQGGVKLMVSTLGKAIAPIIPSKFSDVVLCKKDTNTFSWSTAEANADVKNRNLPLHNKLPPDFAPMYRRWQERSEGAQA
jgi:AAA domain